MEAAIEFGRVVGPRGRSGEVTVKVVSGEAGRWTSVGAVVLAVPGAPPRRLTVEAARAYRDRLVLKLAGIDDPGAAAALRGAATWAEGAEVPALPEGVHWVARLIGAEVVEESGDPLGRVRDVEPTGGADLLHVVGPDGDEVLVPCAREIVRHVDVAAGRIVVRLPQGLRDINRPGAGEP